MRPDWVAFPPQLPAQPSLYIRGNECGLPACEFRIGIRLHHFIVYTQLPIFFLPFLILKIYLLLTNFRKYLLSL